MSNGSSSTSQSPNGRAFNGRVHCHQDQKAKVFKSETKMMLIDCFDVHGIVHAEFLPLGQTNNQNVYENILQRLMQPAREKRIVGNEVMLLHHFNAPALKSLGIREFLHRNNIAVLAHLLPNLAPCEYFASKVQMNSFKTRKRLKQP